MSRAFFRTRATAKQTRFYHWSEKSSLDHRRVRACPAGDSAPSLSHPAGDDFDLLVATVSAVHPWFPRASSVQDTAYSRHFRSAADGEFYQHGKRQQKLVDVVLQDPR